MSVSPGRAAAYEALCRVERDAAFATDALDARLDSLEKRADAALATELTMGVLRWQGLLDFLVSRYTKRAAASLDLEVLVALRLGLYQLRFLSRVPAAAAVNESVELVKRARKRSAAGLANAVLRRAAKDARTRGPAEALLPPDSPLAERLGIALSHPTWLVERWLARFGEPATRALLEANNRPARMTAAILVPESETEICAGLTKAGFDWAPGRWLTGAIELRKMPRGGMAQLRKALDAGGIILQDEASQMIPMLAGVGPGQRALDLCAAPGGKAARLAQQAGQGMVVAADLHPHRVRQMRELLKRAGVTNAHPVALDGTRPLPFAAPFDRVLVDAPCSGTGTLARNPEIRWRLNKDQLPALAEKQKALLRQGLGQLARGGRLVYSTCSLEPEENEQVLEEIAKYRGACVVSAEPDLRRHLRVGAESEGFFDAAGIFRSLPGRDGTDGFFAAAVELGPPGAR